MNDHAIRHNSARTTTRPWPWLLGGVMGIGMLLASLPAQASESQTPWECSNYTGDAHTAVVWRPSSSRSAIRSQHFKHACKPSKTPSIN